MKDEIITNEEIILIPLNIIYGIQSKYNFFFASLILINLPFLHQPFNSIKF